MTNKAGTKGGGGNCGIVVPMVGYKGIEVEDAKLVGLIEFSRALSCGKMEEMRMKMRGTRRLTSMVSDRERKKKMREKLIFFKSWRVG